MYHKTNRAFALATLLTAAVVCGVTATSSQGEARSFAASASGTINVNVSFNMQIPIAGDEMSMLSDARSRGRKMIYKQAVTECPVLLETIAATCRLTGLNVSTQVNRNNSNRGPFMNLSGSAQFSITLKDTE